MPRARTRMSTSSALTLGRGRSITVKVGCRQTLLALKATRCGCTATLVPVMRWTLDELTLARRLFEEVVEGSYRDDHYFRGHSWSVGGSSSWNTCIRAVLHESMLPGQRRLDKLDAIQVPSN